MSREDVSPTNEFERLSLFYPIKLVNGFISCDFKIGCYCCKFCLNRRYADWNDLLNTGKIFKNTLTPEYAVKLLYKTKSFTNAKVTLKIGHDTDMSLEEDEAQELFLRLPSDYPIVFMRRGKILNEHKKFYQKKYPNLLVQLTLTPRSDFLDTFKNPFEILDTFRGIKTSMFYVIAPVLQENFAEAKKLISLLPPDSYVNIKLLTTKKIPGIIDIAEPNISLYDELCNYAKSRGCYVVSYMNCVVRSRIGYTFHKCGEFVHERNIWQLRWSKYCKVKEKCVNELSEPDEVSDIMNALSYLKLTLKKNIKKIGFKTFNVVVNEDVNFGDEAYLREITGLKVNLINENRKTGSSLSKNIHNRWKTISFFPVEEVHQLGKECYETVKKILYSSQC